MLISFLGVAKLFSEEESGASMVEYGIALVVSATVGVTAMSILGGATAANVSSACGVFGLIC